MSYAARFTWGAATSAYQIEGGRIDGKGQSIWDTFSEQERMRDPGDTTCDHYHRWEEDVRLMAELGLTAYRMSVAWTRVLPEGRGIVNQKGLDFYRRLVDALLEVGIEPWVTLFHWDLPQALEDEGGWPARSTVDAFRGYVEVVASALGDRVKNWITINEPWVAATLGYIEGVFAPGRADWKDGLAAGHHLLLAHGQAVPVIRSRSPGSKVGVAIDCRPASPASPSPADEAAWQHFDGFRNRWYFDPIFGRGYPEDMVQTYRQRGRWDDGLVHPGDLETIGAPIDFLGVNYYTAISVSAGREESEQTDIGPGPNPPDGYTEMGWEIVPSALTEFLVRLNNDYRPPAIVITENGASYSDPYDDQRRIDYLAAHIAATEDAIESGVPVEGYFVWSLLDNLEWTAGFSQRFGLIHVDFETLVRTPKASFDWYRRRIASG
ncbi:MAG: GH1 family beta-glucosidase [Acidimicrobiia bacterium]